MCKKLIYLMTFVLALGSTAQAGVYLWNGSAGDGLWETPLNWIVTDSLWTWPNEEYGNRQVNSDTIAIDILNGDAVSRGSDLGIDGAADGSTTGVLTLDNGSSLTVTSGALATSTDPGRRGQIDILGGSFVTIVSDGNDIRIADDPDTWGMLNIVDSTVDIADDLRLDEGEAYVNISGSSTINADDIIAGDNATGVGYLDISGTATINADDLKTDNGEGHITIAGNATLNLDDLIIDQVDGVGTVDIGGSATVTVADDIQIDEATGTINIGGTATVSNGDDFSVGDDAPGVGTANIGDDATVTVGDILYVAHNADSEGHMTISGNAVVDILDDLIIANTGGVTATLHISGNPTINITDDFYMNDDDDGAPSNSQVIMDGGTVNVADVATFNDDNKGTAEFIMNGGSFYCADYLNLSDNLDGTAHLTMNGGEMITGNRLRLGKDGGEDTGQVRIFMNGGLLQAEELSSIKITDTKIIYTGGDFRIGSASLDEAGMQQLITDGTIVAEGAYSIVTDGAYTALVSKAATGPNPANGAEDVALDATLSWWPGFGAVSHDVYFGTSSPPASVGNVTENSYEPGGLQIGTTYYWQINAVEADGTTHISDIWSFTAMYPSLVAYYTLDNDASDSSGYNLHGTLVGDPGFVEGVAGMALDFDGIDDVVELGKFDVVGQISLAAWVKADDFEINDARIISKANEWSGDNHWWMMSTMSETSLRFRLKTDDGLGTATLISDPVLEAGVWAHVAATWDGSMMRIYMDGVEVANQEKGGSAVAVDPAVSVAIGSQPSDAFASDPSHVAKFFDGLLDDVRIYNRALSADEVSELAGFGSDTNILANGSFESGVDAWEIMDPAETLTQSTEGVTDGTYSMQRNFTSGWHAIDLDVGGFIDVLNANDTLEVDVTCSITAEEMGWWLEQVIVLQGGYGDGAGDYYLESPAVNIASPDGTPTTTTVSFNYGPELTNGPLTGWAKIRLIGNTGPGPAGVLYYDNLRAVVGPAPAP